MTAYLGEGSPYPKPRDVPMPAAAIRDDFFCSIGACKRRACPNCSAGTQPALSLTAPPTESPS